ncbi:hypothetical protein E5D57_002965 [Metarhizium anisopliae]|nr:hypothetical protein E5D57_002965 [Metarhizium anisopliae]
MAETQSLPIMNSTRSPSPLPVDSGERPSQLQPAGGIPQAQSPNLRIGYGAAHELIVVQAGKDNLTQSTGWLLSRIN